MSDHAGSRKPKRTRSGRAWMREHVTDPFVRRAQQDGYRARAAYKLLEIDARDRLIRSGMTVVDLGAAPGSWSQVVAQRLKGRGRILALDLLPIAPISGVETLEADFTGQAALDWLAERLGDIRVDLVLSDMAPNMSGVGIRDQARHYALCELARDFALDWLKPEGAFLVKVFQGQGFEAFRASLVASFHKVVVRKPEASRDRSAEMFLLARGLRPGALAPRNE